MEEILEPQGSASHNFNQVGVIKIDKKEISDEKILNLQLMLALMNVFQMMIFMKYNVKKSEIYNVKKKLEKKISKFYFYRNRMDSN